MLKKNPEDSPEDSPEDVLEYKSKDWRVQGEQPPLVGKSPAGEQMPEWLTVHHQPVHHQKVR